MVIKYAVSTKYATRRLVGFDEEVAFGTDFFIKRETFASELWVKDGAFV